MSYEFNHLKNEINNIRDIDRVTLGLRNRKSKKILTFFYDHSNFHENSKNKIELLESTRSIKDLPNYQNPPAGAKISYAYNDKENNEDNSENNKNLIEKAYSIFSKEEQHFIKDTIKMIGKNHLTNTIMSCFNLSPITFTLGSFLFNAIRVNAQDFFVPPAGYNYTHTEGPWGPSSWNACLLDFTPENNRSYGFCNQLSIDDEYGDNWFGIYSYIGVNQFDWEINPPAYCQDIFKKCRSLKKVWEPLKQILEYSDPMQVNGFYDDNSIYSIGPCIDQRNVESALCPSTTVIYSFNPQRCLQFRGCNSTTHTSSFSRCIDEALANLTGNANNTHINYILPTDSCNLPPPPTPWNPTPPYNPPIPISPKVSSSSSTGGMNSTLSDLTSSSNSNLGWIAAPIIGGLVAIYCLKKHIKNKKKKKEFYKKLKEEKENAEHLAEKCVKFCKLCKIDEMVTDSLCNLNMKFIAPLVSQYAGLKNHNQFKLGKMDNFVIDINPKEMFETIDDEDENILCIENTLRIKNNALNI